MASISTAAREPAEALAPQVKRATRALLKHVRKQGGGKKQLIETHETVSLMIGLRAIPTKGNTGKPLRIAIPHSLHGGDPQICLFVKEEAAKLLKTRLDKTPVPGLAKVIGLDKLRKTYKQYADKRELCASYDLFVADGALDVSQPFVLTGGDEILCIPCRLVIDRRDPVATRQQRFGQMRSNKSCSACD